MNANAIPLEYLSPQEPEPARPELELIEGSGEGAGSDDAEGPELYAVPDKRFTVAKKGGKVVMRRTTSVANGEAKTSEGEEHHRGSGGGWVIRELLRKRIGELEAKHHKSGCDCEFCSA
jgi:hypothetical protein